MDWPVWETSGLSEETIAKRILKGILDGFFAYYSRVTRVLCLAVENLAGKHADAAALNADYLGNTSWPCPAFLILSAPVFPSASEERL